MPFHTQTPFVATGQRVLAPGFNPSPASPPPVADAATPKPVEPTKPKAKKTKP